MSLQQMLPAAPSSDIGITTIIRCLAGKKPAADVWEGRESTMLLFSHGACVECRLPSVVWTSKIRILVPVGGSGRWFLQKKSEMEGFSLGFGAFPKTRMQTCFRRRGYGKKQPAAALCTAGCDFRDTAG